VAEEETGGIVVVDGVEGSGGVELEAKLFDAFDAFDGVGIFDVIDGFDVFDLDDEVPALNRWGGLSAAVDGLLNRWDGLDDPRDVPAVDGLLSR
tara:strand:- start:67 stop:348 length:282 start_codon:yes stop_codon:yes gene_type:complete